MSKMNDFVVTSVVNNLVNMSDKDIASDSNQSGKTPGTDLKEGVPTLVTLQILKSDNPNDRFLKEKLSKPLPTDEVPSVILLLS